VPERSSKTYINVGFQRQFGDTFINLFFGPSIEIDELKKGVVSADTFHAGILFGLSFTD
jgi:hypothetical protein